MDLILHIGTEKTGSTSFQWWGGQNRDALQTQGLRYCACAGDKNHQRLYLWALGALGRDDGFGHMKISNQADYDRLRADLPKMLAREVADAKDAGCHTFILSSEHCHSRLIKPEQVQDLQQMLSGIFESIRVICFVRPQVDVSLSMLATLARGATKVNGGPLRQIQPTRAYYNYLELDDRWSGAFGADAVTYVPYRRRSSMIEFICSEYDLDETAFAPPNRSNSAFDMKTLAIVNALSALPDSQQRALRPILNPLLESLPLKDIPLPSVAEARDIQSRFDDSNQKLISRRSELAADDLTPDWTRFPEVGNLDQLDNRADHDDHTALLVLQLIRRVLIAELRTAVALAERIQIEGQSPAQMLPGILVQRNRLAQLDEDLPKPLQHRIKLLENAASQAA